MPRLLGQTETLPAKLLASRDPSGIGRFAPRQVLIDEGQAHRGEDDHLLVAQAGLSLFPEQ